MRILGHEGKSQQVAGLAEAFHHLPLMLWTGDFSMNCRRDLIASFEEKHGVPHPRFDYFAEFEKAAVMTECFFHDCH